MEKIKGYVRSASLRSSFFCLIFSLSCSPSRFAARIFSCQSDITGRFCMMN